MIDYATGKVWRAIDMNSKVAVCISALLTNYARSTVNRIWNVEDEGKEPLSSD